MLKSLTFARFPSITREEHLSLSLSDSVVAVAFQIAFRAKIHANDFFYFLKIIFDISTSK